MGNGWNTTQWDAIALRVGRIGKPNSHKGASKWSKKS
jgi:hypothetical protein